MGNDCQLTWRVQRIFQHPSLVSTMSQATDKIGQETTGLASAWFGKDRREAAAAATKLEEQLGTPSLPKSKGSRYIISLDGCSH